MTTVEKLLVQIFERKNWIIEQVKQRTESYDQHLASKLLIDGITPPSWLWSPNNSSETELNKEELVSRMLDQYPQPSVRCSSAKYPFYNYPVVTGDDGDISDGVFKETLASNKGLNRQYDPKAPSIDGEEHAGCTHNTAPEPEVSITSPEDERDERILNTSNAPDQSLARIQRSKSRQKALELRSRGKARAKTDLSHENSSDVYSCRITLSTFDTEQAPKKDQLPELVEGRVIVENSKDQDLGETYCQNKGKGIGTYTGRVTRSRSHAKVPDFIGDSLELGCSAGDYVCSHGAKATKMSSMSILDSEQDDYVNKLRKSNGPSTCYESCGGREILGSGKDMENNFDTGRMFQSKCSSKCASDFSKADSSSDDAWSIDNAVMGLADNFPADCVDGSLVKVNSSDVLDDGCRDQQSISADRKSQKGMDAIFSCGRMTRSSSSSRHNACIDDTPDRDLPLHSAEADVGVPQSRGRSVGHGKAAEGLGSVSSSCQHNASIDDIPDQDLSLNSAEADVGVLPQSHGRSVGHGKEAEGLGSVSSSSQHNACIDDTPDQDLPLHPAEADAGILPQSHGRSVGHGNAADGLEVKPSFATVRRVTMSRTRSIDNPMMGLVDNLPADHVDGSPVKVNSSNVLDEGCGDQQSISADCKSQKEMDSVFSYGRIARSSSSSQHNACIDDTPDQDLPLHSAGADDSLRPQSHGRSAGHGKAVEGVGSAIPFFATVHRLTTSQTFANDQDISNPVHSPGLPPFVEEGSRSTENRELLNASAAQVIPCYEISCMPDEQEDADFVVGSVLDSQDLVEQSISSSLDDVEKKRELESRVALPLSNSFVLVEPKELDFNILEEYNLKTSTSSSGKKMPDSFSETMLSSSSDAAVSIDNGISGGINHVSTGEESPKMSDGLSKKEEVPMDSLVSRVQNNLDTWTVEYAPSVSEHNMSKSSQVNSEAERNCKNSEVQEEADIMISKLVGTADSQIHPVELYLEEGHDSLLKQQTEEGNWSGDGKNKGLLVPNVSSSGESLDCLMEKVEVEISTSNVCDKKELIPAHKFHESCLEGVISSQHADLPLREKGLGTISTDGSPQVGDLSLERRLRPSSIESWPQLKRRKIEHQQTNSCTSFPSFRIEKLHTIQRSPARTCSKNTEMDVDDTVMNAFELTKNSNTEIHQGMNSHLTGLEITFKAQNEEVPFCFKEHNEQKMSPTIISDKKLGVPLVSSATKKKTINSQGDFVEGVRSSDSSCTHFDAVDAGHCCEHSGSLHTNVDNIYFEDCSLTTKMILGTKSSQSEDDLLSQCSLRSPSNNDLNLMGVDQAMPVFEGFIVGAQADRDKMDFAADGFDFENLNSRTTIERASILANICRSTSVETPLSNFSSALQFRGTQNLFQSVPNRLLECLDFSTTLPSKIDLSIQLGSGNSLVNDAKDAFERMPYSDFQPYSSPRYGRNFRNQLASPVGKFWERLSSHTGSSEKRLSSNPELTCFTIEEDPCIGEENEDEIADDATEEIDSVSANQGMRQPFKDLSNLGLIHHASISSDKEILGAGRVDFVSATQDKVQQCKNRYRNNSEIREEKTTPLSKTGVKKNPTLSIGANGIMKAKKTINNSIVRSNLPSKSIQKRQEQKLSLKESRRNNIVSNVSSFVPLVQQRQAVSICAGKRDVKVKSLEAAEAAKRLAEKRENERKIRKEAMKLERAKLEEKNLRQMEVEKKNKEMERKKKDAEIITKKRLREEEERKEKEKKRMRVEARQRQRGQEEKTRAEKAEKEKQRSKDEQMNSKKEYNKPQKQQNKDVVRGEAAAALKETETKSTHSGFAVNHEKCGTSGDSLGAGEAMHTVDKSPSKEDRIVQKSRGSSYEISPYQCSDDEDEDVDELPTKKHVPSWASKSSMALLLPSQQEMDPDVIFPLESFCSMDEVLRSRRLPQKRVAV